VQQENYSPETVIRLGQEISNLLQFEVFGMSIRKLQRRYDDAVYNTDPHEARLREYHVMRGRVLREFLTDLQKEVLAAQQVIQRRQTTDMHRTEI